MSITFSKIVKYSQNGISLGILDIKTFFTPYIYKTFQKVKIFLRFIYFLIFHFIL